MADNSLERVSTFLKMNKVNENSCLSKCAKLTLYLLLIAGFAYLVY